MSRWFQSPYNSRHPRLKETATARLQNGTVTALSAGTHVQPVRREYIPYGHWVHEARYEEGFEIAVYTERYGIVLVVESTIDFSK